MFDLSMQSALDIFCYVLVLIYGLALSADLSTGGYVSRQQKYLLTLLCLLFLLMQGLGLVLLGERAVKQLYPLVTHVPLVLILILFMKKSVGVAIVSPCTAYLCCQPPRWGRIAVEALTQSTLAAELVYILLMPVMYYLLRRFFVAAAYNTMTSSTAALLLFAEGGWLWQQLPFLTPPVDRYGIGLGLTMALKESAFVLWVIYGLLGEKRLADQATALKSLGYESGLYPSGDYVAVKVPVFSFEKLQDVDTMLGPEMKSTGECLGIGRTFEDALLKGLIAAGYDLKKEGGVLISVRDSDKQEIIPIADRLSRMGFELYGTSGTANVLNHNMIATNLVRKISEGEPNTITLLESGKIHYMISTSEKGRMPARDSVKMRRKSVERSICCLTAIDTASALSKILESGRSIDDVELVAITKI